MNNEEFINGLKDLGIELTKKQQDDLNTYYELLVDYNNNVNLTNITERNEVYLKHFYDSLTLAKSINFDKQTLADVGTGAGFPGLVLKIVFPDLEVTLIDSLNKRITFLNIIIEKLKLKLVFTVHSRAEDFVLNNREKFDIVTSRAVANLRVLSELCIPLVKVGGLFIPHKASVDLELTESLNAIKVLGGSLKEKIVFNLDNDSGKRTLIKIEKLMKTNVKYPRKFGEIKKKPL